MVSATLFLFHILAVLYAFIRYRRESLSDGFLAVGLMVIVFAVGWTITTMLVNLLFSLEWFVRWYYQPTHTLFETILRKEFNRDTLSLILLTVGEIIFYTFFFFPTKKDQNSRNSSNEK